MGLCFFQTFFKGGGGIKALQSDKNKQNGPDCNPCSYGTEPQGMEQTNSKEIIFRVNCYSGQRTELGIHVSSWPLLWGFGSFVP